MVEQVQRLEEEVVDLAVVVKVQVKEVILSNQQQGQQILAEAAEAVLVQIHLLTVLVVEEQLFLVLLAALV